MKSTRANLASLANLILLLLVVLAILAGAYYALRFGGWTMESDASRQTISAGGMLANGELVYPRAYNNGFGYSAQLAFTSLVTGLGLNSVQLGAGAWIFVVALAGFIAYRELFGSTFGGALATFLLLIQPDFLFYIVRGSHERTTWTCALLMLFFLVCSYRFAQSPSRLIANVLLFYLVFWGMVTGNVFFASTFMVAIALSLATGWGMDHSVLRKSPGTQPVGRLWQRLLLVSVICLVIVFIFINYIYSPALQIFSVFNTLLDRLAMLFMGLQPIDQVTAYQYFGDAWRDPAAYLAVTGVQWIIAVASFGIWLWQLFHLSRLEPKQRLLWQLYTSFGVLLALGMAADFAKFLSSNLQLRMFTPFALFSSAMVASGLLALWPRLRPVLRARLVPVVGLVAVLAFFGVQAKITNDPLIANNWMFFSPAEVRAGDWVDGHLAGQQVWVDTWSHLREVLYFWKGYDESRPNDYAYQPGPADYPYILLSQLTQMRANRAGISVPATIGFLKIYDSGTAQLYHLRPKSPYQR